MESYDTDIDSVWCYVYNFEILFVAMRFIINNRVSDRKTILSVEMETCRSVGGSARTASVRLSAPY